MSRPLGTRMLMAVALMAVVLAGCEASSKHPVALSKWDRARAEATLADRVVRTPPWALGCASSRLPR